MVDPMSFCGGLGVDVVVHPRGVHMCSAYPDAAVVVCSTRRTRTKSLL